MLSYVKKNTFLLKTLVFPIPINITTMHLNFDSLCHYQNWRTRTVFFVCLFVFLVWLFAKYLVNITILSKWLLNYSKFVNNHSTSVQSFNRVRLFVTCGLQHARLPCPSPTPRVYSNSCPSSRWWTDHLILCCPLFLLPSIIPSIRVFSNESVLPIRWTKYWSFSFSISLSSEYSGLISIRMDWLDLLAVQGILKNLLQHHSSKTSILWYSTFFIVQISHPYMTTGTTIALTRWTFVGNLSQLTHFCTFCIFTIIE